MKKLQALISLEMMTSNKLDSTGGSKRIVMPQNMFYDSKIVEQNNKQTKRNIYCTRLYGVKV